jgi:hypothetical protein
MAWAHGCLIILQVIEAAADLGSRRIPNEPGLTGLYLGAAIALFHPTGKLVF